MARQDTRAISALNAERPSGARVRNAIGARKPLKAHERHAIVDKELGALAIVRRRAGF